MSDENPFDNVRGLIDQSRQHLREWERAHGLVPEFDAGFAAGIEAAAQEADRYEAGHKNIGAPYEAETFATLAARIRNIKPEASDD